MADVQVWGLGCRVQALGFGVWGLGFLQSATRREGQSLMAPPSGCEKMSLAKFLASSF